MRYEKFKEFVNDRENVLAIRIGMVLFGSIFGSGFVLLSMLFDRHSVGAVTFLIFGCIMFLFFIIYAAIYED